MKELIAIGVLLVGLFFMAIMYNRLLRENKDLERFIGGDEE